MAYVLGVALIDPIAFFSGNVNPYIWADYGLIRDRKSVLQEHLRITRAS